MPDKPRVRKDPEFAENGVHHVEYGGEKYQMFHDRQGGVWLLNSHDGMFKSGAFKAVQQGGAWTPWHKGQYLTTGTKQEAIDEIVKRVDGRDPTHQLWRVNPPGSGLTALVEEHKASEHLFKTREPSGPDEERADPFKGPDAVCDGCGKVVKTTYNLNGGPFYVNHRGPDGRRCFQTGGYVLPENYTPEEKARLRGRNDPGLQTGKRGGTYYETPSGKHYVRR